MESNIENKLMNITKKRLTDIANKLEATSGKREELEMQIGVWGVFWTQETREGESDDTKGGEAKTSPTLIPLYNFILGQPMLVFCANMEPLPFPVSDGAWKDASFAESRSLQSES